MKVLDEYDLKVLSWLMTLVIAISEKETSPMQGVGLLELAAKNWKEHIKTKELNEE